MSNMTINGTITNGKALKLCSEEDIASKTDPNDPSSRVHKCSVLSESAEGRRTYLKITVGDKRSNESLTDNAEDYDYDINIDGDDYDYDYEAFDIDYDYYDYDYTKYELYLHKATNLSIPEEDIQIDDDNDENSSNDNSAGDTSFDFFSLNNSSIGME